MPPSIRLSQTAKDQLIRLKRLTGAPYWNTLCRFALTASFAETSPPATAKIPADSNIEIEWKTFGGQYHELYWALLVERVRRDGLPVDEETLALQLRLHVHRGLGLLTADREIKDPAGLFRRLVRGGSPPSAP
jgi:DNA sulfur modification protein DndE